MPRPAGRAAGALLLCVAVVAGCAGTDDEPPIDTTRPTDVIAAGTAAAPDAPAADAAPADEPVRIGLVAPSAVDDAAWTEAMVVSLGRLGEQRAIEVDVSADPDDGAGAAIREYAQAGYDLVIAHGTQFGADVEAIAGDFPEVSFAIGTATDFFDRPNVFAYSVEAAEGGYVNGVIAAQLTQTGVIGVVGPVPAGDAEAYVDGFVNGVAATDPAARVRVEYIDSFDDVRLASEAAGAQVAGGADVLSGTAQLVTGAIDVARAEGIPWLGTQADQTDLADVVVAAQVYRWEPLLERMLDRIASGVLGGEALVTSFADGGIEPAYNEAYSLDPSIRASADAAVAAIVAGSIDVAAPG